MQDLALALALAAYNVGSLIPEAGQLHLPYVAFALAALQAVLLTWRRRWPVATFLAVGIPRSLYDQLGIGFAPLPLASAIAYYTVMDRCSTRVRWVISALLLAGIIRSQLLPGHTEPYDFFVVVLQFAAAGMPASSAAPAGPTCRRSRREPARRRSSVTGRWRWPPRRSGPGSPGSCTTWWRITSA